MTFRHALFAGLSLSLVAACGGDKDATPTTSSIQPPPTSTAASTSSTAPTTTMTPTTASISTTTTEPPTTTTPATEAPTTTAAPTPEAAVRQALQDYFKSYDECGLAPAECDPTAFSAPDSEAQKNLVKFFGDMKGRDLRFSPDDRGSYKVIEAVEVGADVSRLSACLYDAGVVLGPDGPDGQPTVVNDAIESVRNRYEMRLIAGSWLLAESVEIDYLGEGDKCGGSSR